MLKVLAVCWLSVNIRFYNNVVHCTEELFRVGFSDLILRWYFTSKSTKTKQNKSCESNDEIINLEIYFRAIRLAHIFFSRWHWYIAFSIWLYSCLSYISHLKCCFTSILETNLSNFFLRSFSFVCCRLNIEVPCFKKTSPALTNSCLLLPNKVFCIKSINQLWLYIIYFFVAFSRACACNSEENNEMSI